MDSRKRKPADDDDAGDGFDEDERPAKSARGQDGERKGELNLNKLRRRTSLLRAFRP